MRPKQEPESRGIVSFYYFCTPIVTTSLPGFGHVFPICHQKSHRRLPKSLRVILPWSFLALRIGVGPGPLLRRPPAAEARFRQPTPAASSRLNDPPNRACDGDP